MHTHARTYARARMRACACTQARTRRARELARAHTYAQASTELQPAPFSEASCGFSSSLSLTKRKESRPGMLRRGWGVRVVSGDGGCLGRGISEVCASVNSVERDLCIWQKRPMEISMSEVSAQMWMRCAWLSACARTHAHMHALCAHYDRGRTVYAYM